MTIVSSRDTYSSNSVKKHGVKGYEKGCRCIPCTTANTVKSARYRAKQKLQNNVGSSTRIKHVVKSQNPVIVESVKRSMTNSFTSTGVRSGISAQNQAREDMAGILTGISTDPQWCRNIDEGVSGEIAALVVLISRHNETGNFPPIQYGSNDGSFWVSAADEIKEMPIITEPNRVSVPRKSTMVVLAQQSTSKRDQRQTSQDAHQLPQNVPLARPRDVRTGKAPTVATGPVRTSDTSRNSVTDSPTYG